MKHYMTIVETREMLIEVEADNEGEALDKVKKAYNENEISLYNVKCNKNTDMFLIETSRVEDGFVKGYYNKDDFIKL